MEASKGRAAHYHKYSNKMNLYHRIFRRWTKWELHEENVRMVKVWGAFIYPGHVLADIYVKTNKYNGLKKYKTVVKQ